MENFDYGRIMSEAIEDAKQQIGRINVIVAGKTGVGKSTLVNSIFQGNLAETGQGKPVTKSTREITKEGIPVSIFDTRGLETKEYKQTISELKSFISDKRNETDLEKQIHVAWVCISEDSRRVEDAEIDLVEMLSEYIPVIVIITKSRLDNGFKEEVKRLLPKSRNVIRVRAITEELDDGHKIDQMGLESLVEITEEVIPEGKRNAFIAAQKASIKKKAERSQKVVVAAAAAALAAGASPIPFSDAAILIPIEIGMLAKISSVFGLNLTKGLLGTLVSSMIGTTGATIGGKAIVSGLLKLIPGIGTIAGAAISGTTAGLLTTSLGEMYIGSLVALFTATQGEKPTDVDIEKEFKTRLIDKPSLPSSSLDETSSNM